MRRASDRILVRISDWMRSTKTSRTQRQDFNTYVRRRPAWAEVMAAIQNLYLRVSDSMIRIRSGRDWLVGEPATYRQCLGRKAYAQGNCVILPFVPGETLEALLRATPSASDRQRLIGMAAAELRRMHGRRLDGEWFAHGDATSHNVLIDVASGSVVWIDFETCFVASTPTHVRQAADVRALLLTCVAALPEGEHEIACKAVALPFVADADLMPELIRQLTRETGLYEFAQAYVPAADRRALARRLQTLTAA